MKALTIREIKLGPYNPDTKVIYKKIGDVYMELGDKEKAEEYFDKVKDKNSIS